MSHNHYFMDLEQGTVCGECYESPEQVIARLQRERDEAQEAWASEAAAHAKATEIIYEQEEEELQLQAAYEAQLAEMRAALERFGHQLVMWINQHAEKDEDALREETNG